MVLKHSNSPFNSGNNQRLCNKVTYNGIVASGEFNPALTLNIGLEGIPWIYTENNTGASGHVKALAKIFEHLGIPCPSLKEFYAEKLPRYRPHGILTGNFQTNGVEIEIDWQDSSLVAERFEALLKCENFLEGEDEDIVEIHVKKAVRLAHHRHRDHHRTTLKETVVLSRKPKKSSDVMGDEEYEEEESDDNEEREKNSNKSTKDRQYSRRGKQRRHLHVLVKEKETRRKKRMIEDEENEDINTNQKKVTIELSEPRIDTRVLGTTAFNSNAELKTGGTKSLPKSKGWVNGKMSRWVNGYNTNDFKRATTQSSSVAIDCLAHLTHDFNDDGYYGDINDEEDDDDNYIGKKEEKEEEEIDAAGEENRRHHHHHLNLNLLEDDEESFKTRIISSSSSSAKRCHRRKRRNKSESRSGQLHSNSSSSAKCSGHHHHHNNHNVEKDSNCSLSLFTQHHQQRVNTASSQSTFQHPKGSFQYVSYDDEEYLKYKYNPSTSSSSSYNNNTEGNNSNSNSNNTALKNSSSDIDEDGFVCISKQEVKEDSLSSNNNNDDNDDDINADSFDSGIYMLSRVGQDNVNESESIKFKPAEENQIPSALPLPNIGDDNAFAFAFTSNDNDNKYMKVDDLLLPNEILNNVNDNGDVPLRMSPKGLLSDLWVRNCPITISRCFPPVLQVKLCPVQTEENESTTTTTAATTSTSSASAPSLQLLRHKNDSWNLILVASSSSNYCDASYTDLKWDVTLQYGREAQVLSEFELDDNAGKVRDHFFSQLSSLLDSQSQSELESDNESGRTTLDRLVDIALDSVRVTIGKVVGLELEESESGRNSNIVESFGKDSSSSIDNNNDHIDIVVSKNSSHSHSASPSTTQEGSPLCDVFSLEEALERLDFLERNESYSDCSKKGTKNVNNNNDNNDNDDNDNDDTLNGSHSLASSSSPSSSPSSPSSSTAAASVSSSSSSSSSSPSSSSTAAAAASVSSSSSSSSSSSLSKTNNESESEEERKTAFECDVCFNDTFEGFGFNTAGLVSLLPCGHTFCYECWRKHVLVSFTSGAGGGGGRRRGGGGGGMDCGGIKCMDTSCDEVLDETTLTALMPHDFMTAYCQRRNERRIDMSPLTRWCPQTGCRKVAMMVVDKSSSPKVHQFGATVVCGGGDCGGTSWCFGCQTDPHWPASCGQVAAYKKLLAKVGNGLTASSGVSFDIECKPCPGCGYPIEKDHGCPYMICWMCSYEFCWNCLRSTANHNVYYCRTGQGAHFLAYQLHSKYVHTFPLKFFSSCVELRKKKRSELFNDTKLKDWLNGLRVVPLGNKLKLPFLKSVQSEVEDFSFVRNAAARLARETLEFLDEVYPFLEMFKLLLSFALVNDDDDNKGKRNKKRKENETKELCDNFNYIPFILRRVDRLEFTVGWLEDMILLKHVNEIIKVRNSGRALLQSGREIKAGLVKNSSRLQTMSKDVSTEKYGAMDPLKFYRYK